MELRIHICFWLKLGFKRLVLLVEDVMCDSGVGSTRTKIAGTSFGERKLMASPSNDICMST